MVTRRPRSAFAVLLAFALLPIVSIASSRLGTGARAGVAWMQGQAKAQSPVQDVRAGFGELARQHADETPFTPAEVFSLAASRPPVAGAASVESIPGVAVVATLHPARAPPALS